MSARPCLLVLAASVSSLCCALPIACSSDTARDPAASAQEGDSTRETTRCSDAGIEDARTDAGVGCAGPNSVEPAPECTLIGCGAPLNLVVPLELAFSSIVQLGLETCWNDHCIDVKFANLEEPQPGAGVGVWKPEPAVGSEGVGWLETTLWSEADGTYRLDASWNDGVEFSPTDGDTFRATLTDADGALILALDEVVEYEASYPNGRYCGTCLSADFEGDAVRVPAETVD